MKFDLTFKDKELPFEQILEFIRKNKITNVNTKFSIDTGNLHYNICGEIEKDTGEEATVLKRYHLF